MSDQMKTLGAGHYQLTTNDPVLLALHRDQGAQLLALVITSFGLGLLVMGVTSGWLVVPLILLYTGMIVTMWNRLRVGLLAAISHVLMVKGVEPHEEC